MLQLYHGSLLDLDVDAIVNAANSGLMGGGGVDGAIHRAAGPRLKEACRPLAPCPPGDVRVTEGFGLAPRLIFHTVGPIWQDGHSGEDDILQACYLNCLTEAAHRKLRSIAFPAISTGVYGFPHDRAAAIAVKTCETFANGFDLDISLVAFEERTVRALESAMKSLKHDI